MKKQWTKVELIEHFILLPPEKQLVETKYSKSQLIFAVLFKYFQYEARFPENAEAVPFPIVEFISKQLRTIPDQFYHSWKSRTIERYVNSLVFVSTRQMTFKLFQSG